MTTEMMASNVVETKSILDWFKADARRVIDLPHETEAQCKAKSLICFLVSQQCFESSIEKGRGR